MELHHGTVEHLIEGIVQRNVILLHVSGNTPTSYHPKVPVMSKFMDQSAVNFFTCKGLQLQNFKSQIAISHLNHNVPRHETLDVHVYTQREIYPLADTNMQLYKRRNPIFIPCMYTIVYSLHFQQMRETTPW